MVAYIIFEFDMSRKAFIEKGTANIIIKLVRGRGDWENPTISRKISSIFCLTVINSQHEFYV